MSLYLETARKSADKYIQYGIEPVTKLLFSQIYTNGTPINTQNFAEEERLYQSLIKLSELSGDPKYRQAGINAVKGLLDYAMHPTTGVIPMGDSNGYYPITQARSANSTFTENYVPMEPIYNLSVDKPKTLKVFEAYYNYFSRSNGSFCDLVNVTTGACAGGHNAALDASNIAGILVEAFYLTGNPKYLQRAEAMWTRWMNIKENVIGQGDTGLFYGYTDPSGNRWFQFIYDWSFARSLAKALKYTNSSVILQAAKEHVDAMIQYSFNLDGKYGWAHPINADTGQAASTPVEQFGYNMASFAEMYMDECLLELYKKTGDSKYLTVVEQNVPTALEAFPFPTHHVPEIIIRNIDLYKTTFNQGRLDTAKAMADQLVNWIVAQGYWIWGGLEEETNQWVGVDNFWHSVLALLQMAEVLSVPRHILTITSVPIPVTVEINPL